MWVAAQQRFDGLMSKKRPFLGLNRGQISGRVETWRGGFRQSIAVADPFGCRCLSGSAVLRFHVPLIEPDVPLSGIRLSDQVHPQGVHSPVIGSCLALRHSFRGGFWIPTGVARLSSIAFPLPLWLHPETRAPSLRRAFILPDINSTTSPSATRPRPRHLLCRVGLPCPHLRRVSRVAHPSLSACCHPQPRRGVLAIVALRSARYSLPQAQ